MVTHWQEQVCLLSGKEEACQSRTASILPMTVTKTATGLVWTALFKKYQVSIEGDFEYIAHDKFIYVAQKLPDNRTRLSVYEVKNETPKDSRVYDYYFGGFFMDGSIVKLKLYNYNVQSWYSAYLAGTAGLQGFGRLG